MSSVSIMNSPMTNVPYILISKNVFYNDDDENLLDFFLALVVRFNFYLSL